MINQTAAAFVDITKSVPGFLHFDSIGFFNLSEDKKNLLESTSQLLNLIQERGGNIFVPSYSYTYTKKEVYSMKDSPSDLGRASDSIRQKNFLKRTSDALFSYLSFSDWTPAQYFKPLDYESFGKDSLIAKVFDVDGYLMSVGGRLHQSTEVHYLEKLMGMTYRMDKDFAGEIVTIENQKYSQTIKYFCRDLGFAEKYNATVSFERLFKDMDAAGLVEKRNVDGALEIEFVHYQRVYSFLQKKIPQDPFYLMVDKRTMKPIKN